MTLLGSFRAHFETRARDARASLYAAARSDAERYAAQLGLLNAAWQETAAAIPYFARLRERGALPARFESLGEFAARVPPMTRASLQRDLGLLTHPRRKPDRMRITGGSTAEPVQIPAWSSEFAFTKSDMWQARHWYGIEPAARLFLLWGHSHLLGHGLAGRLAALQRRASDQLLGYRRFSAYDLSPAALVRAADELLRFRPDYLIGYSVALDLFARANAERRDALRAVGVKLVLAAAEGFPAPDSEARLADLFGCPVGMEYGAVETNLVAHTQPEGGYRVFWRSYLVEAERSGAHHRLRVTSLYPRCVPLVRYELGDEIEPWDAGAEQLPSVLSFRRVIGRCNDFVLLADGTPAHSELFTHCVRSCASIRSYQVIQEGERIRLCYEAARELEPEEESGIRERLGRIHGELARIPIARVPELERTIAGKTPMVIRRPAAAASPPRV